MWTPLPAYAELHCLSNFSFQRGASRPEELVARAAALGYSALAITDECSVAGVVRAHTQAKKLGLHLLLGSEFSVRNADAGPEVKLVVLVHDLQGWGNLCEFITAARGKAVKGSYDVSWSGSDFAQLQCCEVLLAPPRARANRCRTWSAQCALASRCRSAVLRCSPMPRRICVHGCVWPAFTRASGCRPR